MTALVSPLVFTVQGKPAPKGSLKPVRVGKGSKARTVLVEQLAASKPWRKEVKAAALAAVAEREGTGDPYATLSGPVEVEVVFGCAKPKGAPKRRRTWPVTRSSGDVDKLQRNLLDALVDAAVLADDSQVVKVTASKVYAGEGDDGPLVPTPGAWVMVRPLPEAVWAARQEAAGGGPR